MPHSKNFLLNRIDAATLDRISPDLSVIHIAQVEVLAETHEARAESLFPTHGYPLMLVETIA
jgi:hypothetical protein